MQIKKKRKRERFTGVADSMILEAPDYDHAKR